MFFNRNKDDHSNLQDSEMTPGMKETIDEIVAGWGEVKRGLRDARLVTDAAPVQITRKADVDYLVKSMEDEADRISAEIEQSIKDKEAAHRASVAQKDAELASVCRDIENLEAKIKAQDEEIERRALALVDAREIAQKIYPSFDGKDFASALSVRREVVRRRCGDAAVDGKSEAYIDERFELLAARVNTDPFAVVMSDGIQRNDPKAECERAYQDMVRRLRDAHKQPPEI